MNKKEMNNKGFSLIELIVVIAIMAILVGALAPQLLKYIEKSRQANDVQAAGTYYTVLTTAMADPDVTGKPASGSTVGAPASSTAGDFYNEVYEALGQKTAVPLTSEAYTGTGASISAAISSTGEVIVTLTTSNSALAPTKTVDASGAHT